MVMIKKLKQKKGARKMYVEHLEQIEVGIYENPNATEPSGDAPAAHYKENAIKILDDDLYHYQCMARALKESPIFAKEFYSVADIAGGHPKLASFMNIAGEVTVYDHSAKMYKSLHKEFAKRYPIGDTPVKYEKKSVTHPNFTPNAEVAICCHILEHLGLDQIRRMLGNLETDKVIVYGPDIAKATNEKWFHFRPADHRTFATLDAMKGLIEEAGFKVQWAAQYHQDYIIYGDK